MEYNDDENTWESFCAMFENVLLLKIDVRLVRIEILTQFCSYDANLPLFRTTMTHYLLVFRCILYLLINPVLCLSVVTLYLKNHQFYCDETLHSNSWVPKGLEYLNSSSLATEGGWNWLSDIFEHCPNAVSERRVWTPCPNVMSESVRTPCQNR